MSEVVTAVVWNVSPGLSGAEAALYGAIIAGAFTMLGVVIGLVMDRVLQRLGKVRCHMEPIELLILATRGAEKTVRTLPLPEGMLDEEIAERNSSYGDTAIRCFIEAKLFNNKEIKTGIRDVVVVFEGRSTVELKVRDRSTWRPYPSTGQRQMDYLEDMNLPSREWVPLSLMGDIGLEDSRKLTSCDKAWLRGYLPDDTRFNERVPFAKEKRRGDSQ
jgi:hypothetical protein